MRLIAVLLVTVLAGCANTPWRAEYAKAGIEPVVYKQEREQCKTKAWDDALITTGGQYSGDLFLHFVQRNMLDCMKAKGYEPIGIHPDAYKQSL